jgi:hypothetical protein
VHQEYYAVILSIFLQSVTGSKVSQQSYDSNPSPAMSNLIQGTTGTLGRNSLYFTEMTNTINGALGTLRRHSIFLQ